MSKSPLDKILETIGPYLPKVQKAKSVPKRYWRISDVVKYPHNSQEGNK